MRPGLFCLYAGVSSCRALFARKLFEVSGQAHWIECVSESQIQPEEYPNMRYLVLAAMLVIAGAAPALAGKRVVSVGAQPTFDDCFRLAWVRGVHVERDELDAFNEECLANKVPFNSGMAVDSVVRRPY
jgi:hypothetical protein